MQNEISTLQVSISTEYHVTFQIIENKQEYPLATSFEDNKFIDEIIHLLFNVNESYFYHNVNNTNLNFIQKKEEIQSKIEQIQNFIQFLLRNLQQSKSYEICQIFLYVPNENYFRVEMMKNIFRAIGIERILVNGEVDCEKEMNCFCVSNDNSIETNERMNDTVENVNDDSDEIKSNFNEFNDFENNLNELEFEWKENSEMRHMNIGNKLNNQCIFLASRYFNSMNDYINCEFVTKRFRGIFCQFQHNPIPFQPTSFNESIKSKNMKVNDKRNKQYKREIINQKERLLFTIFPNMKQQYIYSKDDIFLQQSQIQKYIVICDVQYNESFHISKTVEQMQKKVIYKSIVYSTTDREIDYHRFQESLQNETLNNTINNDKEFNESDKSNQSQEEDELFHFPIPPKVTKLDDKCFSYYFYIKSITLPTSLTMIGKECFRLCYNLQEIKLPSSLTFFDSSWFVECPILTKITLSDKILQLPNHAFYDYDQLCEITLPKNLTSLPHNCFYNCKSLSTVNGIEHIQTIKSTSFYKCPYSSKLPRHLKHQNHSKSILTQKEIQILSEWTGLQCGDILFDSFVDNWSIDSSEFDAKILFHKNLLFVIQTEQYEKFGCFYGSEIAHVTKFDSQMNYVRKQVDEQTNEKTFLFNLQSNKRLSKPMKFDIVQCDDAYKLFPKNHKTLIHLGKVGQIRIMKNDSGELSSCFQSNKSFDYQNINHALCGKTDFSIQRFCVFQMI